MSILSREYHRNFERQHYKKMRDELTALLGGRCVVCGTNDGLQFDHIDRDNKSFVIAKMWGKKREVVLEEIKKCQLLCDPCHRVKTLLERGHKPNKLAAHYKKYFQGIA